MRQYTYIVTLPTFSTFAIGNASIKYMEGFIYFPGHGSGYRALRFGSWRGWLIAHSYPKAIPIVDKGTSTVHFSADDASILHMGVGDVSLGARISITSS